MKSALVLGAGGFIGSHMVKKLKEENYYVRGVDVKYPDFSDSHADEFVIYDLTLINKLEEIFTYNQSTFDEIYQYAADMGGAGYIFSGDNDANVMTNSSLINLNVLSTMVKLNLNKKENSSKVFYASSACIYPEYNQLDPDNPNCTEDSAYPAMPDSEYGWEKLFSERLYLSYFRNFNIDVKIGRFHNIFGPEGTFDGGKEKAPAAICRKIINASNEIEIWGDGKQTRSFLFIDECINATRALMSSSENGPFNIGSEEMVSINELVEIVSNIANKKIAIKHIDGPLGVRGRNSDNTLINEKLNWNYKMELKEGLAITYNWIQSQIQNIE